MESLSSTIKHRVTNIHMPENRNKNEVDKRFKIVYAIGMLSVIAGHCCGKCSIELNINGWFHYRSFHMPLFMFAAGYFYKIKNNNNICDYLLRKLKRLVIPIYLYNFFYGFYIQLLKHVGFRNNNNLRPFSFEILFVEPLGGGGFRNIAPSWFSSSLFFVEAYNIIKRKLISFLFKQTQEFIYLLIDIHLSFFSVILSNKGYNKKVININILRVFHLNIYYELGIFYKKYIENSVKKVRNDIIFLTIFTVKLCFHLYYSIAPVFSYISSQYYNYSPFTVITISVSGIIFWIKISEILEPILGTNFYINIIADNTYSIMINHFLALDLIKSIFAIISKNTKYCKDFNFKRYYSLDKSYIYIPNKVLQSGIIYYLGCLIIPIIMQKTINNIKKLYLIKRKIILN